MFYRLLARSLFSSTILALSIGIVSCANTDNNQSILQDKKPTVVASYSVLCDFTQTIAQNTVDLTCLIDPDRDPHAYNPTPSDRKAIETAQLVLYGGYEFEPKIIALIEATNTPAPKVAVDEKAVPKPIMGEHYHKDEHKEALEPDPHVWHNVENAIAMVEVIRTQLAEVNPNQAQLYRNNAKALTDKLEQLDTWVKAQIATIAPGKRTLVTTHDALGYYVQAYGLNAVESLQGLSDEEAPAASRVKELVKTVQQTKVPTIFTEITADDQVIGTVARESNVKISEQELFADGLGEKGSATGTYIGMMMNNTCAIVDGLGGKCTPFESQ